MILKWNFAQICAFQWTTVKWCFGRVFFHFTIFGFKNAKINFLKKIRVKIMSAVFFRFEVQVFSNRSSGLEKNAKPLRFCLWTIFYEFFKKAHFPHFLIFSKIINCTYLNHCMRFILCKHVRTKKIQLDQPILNSYSFKTGVHFRLYVKV